MSQLSKTQIRALLSLKSKNGFYDFHSNTSKKGRAGHQPQDHSIKALYEALASLEKPKEPPIILKREEKEEEKVADNSKIDKSVWNKISKCD